MVMLSAPDLHTDIFYGNSQGVSLKVEKGGLQWNTYDTVVVVAYMRGID